MRSILSKAALLAASAILSVLFVEFAFRIYEQHVLIHEIDPKSEVFDLQRLKYNDHGGLLERRRAEGEVRILSFGDSFAQGVTLPPYTYAAVLERDLVGALGGRSVRVVNFGRGGTSFPDYVAEF
jgi:hypothetical protein